MGRSYPTSTMTRARELHEAGWLCGQIADILDSEIGAKPSEVTIRRWVDPDYAEAQRASQRTGGERTRKWGWRLRLRRALDLRSAGLSYSAIAKLFALDFGLSLSVSQVEAIVKGDCEDRTVKRLLSAEGAGR